MSDVNKQMLDVLVQLAIAETGVINAKAWSAGEQTKKHCDFALTAIATARQAMFALSDCIKTLLIEAGTQPQWQPIETAPREELRDLIVFNGNVQHGQWWEGYWIDSMEEYMNPQPTKWMPLPPEPNVVD